MTDNQEKILGSPATKFSYSHQRVSWEEFMHDESFRLPANHYYVWRSGYTHHFMLEKAFYLKDDNDTMQVRIIHFTGDRRDKSTASIRRDSFQIQLSTEEVISSSSNSAELYGTSLVEGRLNCALSKKYPTTHKAMQQAVTRALLYWSGQRQWGKYDLRKNNCEYFVRYAVTGQMENKQVNLAEAAVVASATAVIGALIFGVVKRIIK